MDADFYVGLGESAVWLGSVAGLGDPATAQGFGLFNDGPGFRDDYDESDYRELVRDIVTSGQALPDADAQGWLADEGDPWPWDYDRSNDTDYAYMWVNGCIHVFQDGYLLAQHYPNGARRPSSFPAMIRQHPTDPVAGS